LTEAESGGLMAFFLDEFPQPGCCRQSSSFLRPSAARPLQGRRRRHRAQDTGKIRALCLTSKILVPADRHQISTASNASEAAEYISRLIGEP